MQKVVGSSPIIRFFSRVSGFAALLLALVFAASATAGDSLRVTATDLHGNVLLVGRYHVANPAYCLATKPSYSAPNYDEWVSPRCVPYTVQRADFRVTVRYKGRTLLSDSFRIDGAFGDPSRGGTITPYYIYCGLLVEERLRSEVLWLRLLPRSDVYHWTVMLVDPFHRPGYDVWRRGVFHC